MENAETLESRIESLTKNVDPGEVLELDCSGSVASSLAGLLDRFTSLQILDLTGIGLESLKGFSSLPNLCELDLSENHISGGLELLQGCEKLFVLGLCGNPINDFDTLKPLVKLEMLRELDLSRCEVSKLENYREKMFELLKSLIYLDGFDKDKNVEAPSKRYKNKENGDVDDEEDASDEEDDDDEEDDENEVGLSYLQKSDLGDDDSKDYEAAGSEDDDDDDDEEDDDIDEDEDIDEEEIKEIQSEESECGVHHGMRRGMKRKQQDSVEEVQQE